MLHLFNCNICGNIANWNYNGIWYCKKCREANLKYGCFRESSYYQLRLARWYIRSIFRVYQP